MATPTPPTILTPDQRLALEQQQRYARIKHNVALGGALLCPAIMLMPPRKLDLYTLSLGIGFYLSADHLAQAHYQRPLIALMTPSFGSPLPDALPTETARRNAQLAQERREKEAAERARREGVESLGGEKGKRGVLGRLWMGDEEEGWKERRLEEERRALEEGKSYTDIILGQIWEVWNWDKKGGKDGEEGKKD